MTSALQVLASYEQFLARPTAETAADLENYVALLRKWNATHNLVSRETADVWSRHVADSLQLLPLIRPADAVLVDLGSGGGFPAIPLAIALRRRHILIEPAGKKASFLRAASRELSLRLEVETRRAEAVIPAPKADIVTSRALASLANLLNLAWPFFGPATRALFHKGREYSEELAESRAVWQYDVLVHKSRVDDAGVLLEISNLRSN